MLLYVSHFLCICEYEHNRVQERKMIRIKNFIELKKKKTLNDSIWIGALFMEHNQ